MSENTGWYYGLHVIDELLRKRGAEPGDVLFLARNRSDKRVENIISKLTRAQAQIRNVSYKEMTQLVQSENHQGIALQRKENISLNELSFQDIIADVPGFFIAMDKVTDPHNIGAVARSALAMGARGLILPDRGSAPLGGATFKASAGALAHLPVMHTSGISSFLERVYKENSFVQKIGLSMHGDEMTHDVCNKINFNYPVILVAGSEEGLSPLAEKRCDFLWRLPIKEPAESFNVSVAVALALYTLVYR